MEFFTWLGDLISHINWTQVLVALVVGIPATISAVASYRGNRKIDTTNAKIDQNTNITQKAAKAAETAATTVETHHRQTVQQVAQAVVLADIKTAEQVSDIKKMLNGQLDERMERIAEAKAQSVLASVKQLGEKLDQHIAQDETSMASINDSLTKIIANQKR